MTNNELLIFFPTLNEEGNVVPLILELISLYYQADFLVIDDSSMDKTVLNLQNLKRTFAKKPINTFVSRSGKNLERIGNFENIQ